MRTVKFDLNEQAEKLMLDLVESPAYFGDTPRTLFVKLMMQARQAKHFASKPAEPDKPEIGKVELRQQAEREAREEADLAPFRLSGVWPKPRVSMDPEIEFWDFPDGRLESWTPPDDYPGIPHPGNLPDDDGASTGKWLREMEKLKAAGVVKDKVELP